jgi:putative chitinase
MAWLTREMLIGLWPKAKPALIDGFMADTTAEFRKAEVISTLRLAHLMAQLSHESGGGRILVENLNYTTAARIHMVWPKIFADEAAAAPFVKNPQKLANKVYNGRIGNRPDTDDGWNYRGRGLIQITGRDNYRAMGKIAALDLLDHPEKAELPDTVLAVACAYWTSRKINEPADLDDVVKVTKKINPALQGLDDRKEWLAKWKTALKVP